MGIAQTLPEGVSMKQGMKQALAAVLAAGILSAGQGAAATLEEERDSYDAQVEELGRQSDALAGKIDSLSEQKRLLDEEAAAAVAEHKARRAELNATLERLEENEEKLVVAERVYARKSEALGKRVRDIYINGQISYVDVLFGAKDFSDFLTRMDLLKRVIKQDYDLVHEVLTQRSALRALKEELEQDKAAQEPLEKKAREARLAMEDKVEAQQALIEQMKYDKETIDRKQDESRAASERITRMLQRSGLRNLPVQGTGAMIWPLAGPITSDFGWRTHPITGSQRFHSGIDIGGDYGDPIYAAQAGTVEYAGWISGYGNAVIINHGGGISTLYGHCQSLDVSTGQSVAQGELIAECGSTGNSTGPHCHFEVRVSGEPVNPLEYL